MQVNSQTTNIAPGKTTQIRKRPVLPDFLFFSFMKHVAQASNHRVVYFRFNLPSTQLTMVFVTYLKKHINLHDDPVLIV